MFNEKDYFSQLNYIHGSTFDCLDRKMYYITTCTIFKAKIFELTVT